MNYWEIKDDIANLKREGNDEQALALLMQCIEFTEKQAKQKSRPLYDWPYEQATIILRKQKRTDEEIAILERYLKQGNTPNRNTIKFFNRLNKAYKLSGLEEQEISDKGRNFVNYGLIVDTETTGLSNQDELIELAIIFFTYNAASGEINKIEDIYTGLRQPSVPVSKEAENIHHITKQQLAGRKLDDLKVKQLISIANIIIAHNAVFDYQYISKLYPEVNNKQWFCSMNGIKWSQKGHQSKSLKYLLNAYGISEEQSHRGMDDAMGVYKLLQITNPSTESTLFMQLMDNLPLNLKKAARQYSQKQEEVVVVELLLPLPKRKKGLFEKLFGK